MSEHDQVASVAQRHGLSAGAGRALYDALVAGGGRQAQFSHPELGGMGQWSGGMIQIGDMFNDALRAKVNAFCHDLSATAAAPRRTPETDARSASPWAQGDADRWWPAGLGAPASSGAQNDMAYACFPDQRRLAIRREGRVTLYDTGTHQLTGFSQQQPGTGSLAFASQHGPVALSSLREVDS